MELTENTIIKYTLQNKNNEILEIAFTLEQIEGAENGFYEQLRDNLDEKWYEENWQIINRKIMEG